MDTNKLNNLVKSSKLTKSQIAQKCGISHQTLYSILSGADTRVSTLESILNAIGAQMTDLYSNYPSNVATASGKNSIAAVNSEVNGDRILSEKVKYLERILEEKERTIQILIGKK